MAYSRWRHLPASLVLTYLDYIVQFQRLRRQQPFSSVAADLYYHLLWTANSLSWKNPFTEGNPIIMASLGMSDKTLMAAREKLVAAGLLKFTPGKKGCYSTYELLSLPIATEIFRGNWEQSGSDSRSNEGTVGGQSGGNAPPYNRSKIKSKKKESIDSSRAAENSASLSPTLSPPPEPWAAWLAENAPTVQRLKSPLTAKQWGKLVADFTEPLVQEVLLAMENKADLLKKYTSANLTARDWCGRRQPQRSTPVAPVQSTAAPESLKADLNDDVINERQARQEAELAATRRRQRESQTAATSS